MKKHFLKLCFLLTVIVALLISCSKEDNGGATPAAIGLTVFKNKTGEVNANTLQAQYKDPKFDIYFYGNFDANNDPTVIKTVTFQKAANDTIMNMTIDPTTFRITSASTTVKGVQQAVVMKFDYLNNATNDFNVSYYSYNWTTQTGQLFYSTLVENNNGVPIGKPNYAARLSGTKTFDYKLALESLVLSTKIVTAGVVVGALLPEAALVTAAAVLIPGIATGWYFNAAVSTLTNLVIGDAKASDFFPPKTLITNPIIDTNTPIPHLPISTCTNTNIVFTATMDATGAIIFTTINGGQAPNTYMVASGFQQSTVFANNYASGSYLLAVKDANGCVNMKVIPLKRSTSVCGDVTDIDGNIYKSVNIGTQCWLQTNLNVSKYRNGDVIPQVTDRKAWAFLTTGAWCYYDNNTVNGTVYGKLYNWYAVIDPRGLAPTGYHVPTDAEWTTLTTFLGGESVAGGNMVGTDNSSGFRGLNGGERDMFAFGFIGELGYWWSSSENDTITALLRYLNVYGDVRRFATNKTNGFSVRCVKD